MNAIQTCHNSLYKWGAVAITLVAAFLIFFSSLRQSLTVDEPNHIYCGMEYLQYGTYTAWPENPPLSRLIVAIGPYLSGYRIDKVAHDKNTMRSYYSASYNLDYFSKGPVRDKLLWARLFVLPMFLVSVWAVWVWSKALGGSQAAFLGVGMYTTIPAILAHCGLATTDITFVAAFVVLLWCFSRWLEKPTIRNGTWLGISLAASLLAKYTVLVFFPIAAAVMSLFFWIAAKEESALSGRKRITAILKTGTLAVVLCALLVWAFYGFSIGRLSEQPVIAAGIKEGKVAPWIGNLYLPAPEWFAGLKLISVHNARGHKAYLFGQISQHGFKMFYPIALLVKTPLPFLVFLITGVSGAVLPRDKKRNWQLWALILIPVFILASLIPSNINLGLRHILSLYALAAISGAAGTCRLLYYFAPSLGRLRNLIPIGLVTWQLVIAVIAFPNYLSYFNPVAGREPGAIIAGSDLDWGQGLFELSEFCKKHKVDTLNLAYYGKAKDCWYSLPPVKFMSDSVRVHGWIAISEYLYRGVWISTVTRIDSCNLFNYTSEPGQFKINNGYRWLDRYPLVGKAGGSIRIYFVP